MRYRELGGTGLRVSEVGHGTWGIGGDAWKGGTDEESLAALRRSIELGVNFFGTALVYGEGHSERLVGQVLRESKSNVYVATKVPPLNRLWPARAGIGLPEVFPREHIVKSTETSLRNLGVETIDVLQLHVWNSEWDCDDGWRWIFEELRKSGKIRSVGVSISSHKPDSALELARSGLVDCPQVYYNIFDQLPEENLFPSCEKHRVGVIARCPFDEGALAGAVTEHTEFDPAEYRARYFSGDRRAEVLRRVASLREDLAGVESSLADAALRFCLSHPAVSTVIPGMRRPRNVEANCTAEEKGPLDRAALAILRRHAWYTG